MTQGSLTREDFLGWPALVLRQGAVCLHVVPQVGGRLMGIEVDGRQLCFTHPDLHGRCFDGEDEAAWDALCGAWSFPLWGGGKTWIAPEADWPDGAPHRDLDSGAWALIASGINDSAITVALRSPVCRRSGLQVFRTVSLLPDASWRVEQRLVNRGSNPVRCGLWDVLMLKRPAEVIVPRPTSAAALPGRPPLDELRRSGVLALGVHEARIRCREGLMFKCGFGSTTGLMRVEFDDGLRYERRSPVPAGARHAHGHPLEVFNAPELPYFELESHSPLAELAPGEEVSYQIEERCAMRT